MRVTIRHIPSLAIHPISRHTTTIAKIAAKISYSRKK